MLMCGISHLLVSETSQQLCICISTMSFWFLFSWNNKEKNDSASCVCVYMREREREKKKKETEYEGKKNLPKKISIIAFLQLSILFSGQWFFSYPKNSSLYILETRANYVCCKSFLFIIFSLSESLWLSRCS